MSTKLRLIIEDAIRNTLEDACSDSSEILWDEYLHPELASQMTDAAVAVFDAAQAAQKYFKIENEI